MPQESPESATNARLAALREYEIMDTEPERLYDDLTLLASSICGTPISLITLLDDRRQWFKSTVGLSSSETPIEQAFCNYAIQQPDVMVVEDASADWRFTKNPLVTGKPHIRFYAGAPLVTPDGVALGTICVIDEKTRQINDEQKRALEVLARQAVSHLEQRRVMKNLHTALKEVEELREILPMCSYCKKVRTGDNYWQKVEDYLETRPSILLSHGVCEDCYPQAMRDMGLDEEEKE